MIASFQQLFSSQLLQRLLINRIMAASNMSNVASPPAFRNRLQFEKSPYLLQHATNPVDWYPWGTEAIEKARREDKVIFLSVGYSTCHWCHVMERESFENEEVGKLLNEHFVPIKVDREERPDVDKVYMTYIQATSGGGGWPMSVWLTPDLKPIVGGTYFPPDERYYGRPGFKTILRKIASQWQQRRDEIVEQGTSVADMLRQVVNISRGEATLDSDVVSKCYSMLKQSYDEEQGGFSKSPKFPQAVNFNFLFHLYSTKPQSEEGKLALEMCLFTLRQMAKGGIHDHVAQGFHRYSTDKFWHVPHFEKMLYDQAQLAVSYLDAYQITRDDVYGSVARDILEYVARDMTDPSGGFYSAEDADSYPAHDATAKMEGAFCVWSHDEVVSHLSDTTASGTPLSDVYCHHYSVKDGGNVEPYQDPHEELKNKNVLIERGSIEKTADHFSLTTDETTEILKRCNEILFGVRQKRPKPHLDHKMLCSWNGLMISGFSRAGQVFGESRYVEQAVRAATFVHDRLYLKEEGTLLRSGYPTSKDTNFSEISDGVHGFVDDYAFLIRGLLDLYEAVYDERWLELACDLQHLQDKRFWDSSDGGYFTSDGKDPTIILRMKDDQDGAEPSANSVSAMNLLRLASYLNCTEWNEKADKIMQLFSERLTKIPVALPELVSAYLFLTSSPVQVIIVGNKDADDTTAMLQCVHSRFIPNKVLLLLDSQKSTFLSSQVVMLSSLKPIDGKATAYVCQNYACQLPITSVEELDKVLNGDNK